MNLNINAPIEIPDSPNFNEVPKVAEYCKEIGVDSILFNDESDLIKLSPSQFLFICGVNGKLEKNFNITLNLIKTYIQNIPKENIDLLLNLENALYIHYIKNFDNQSSYNQFFDIFVQKYKSKKQIKTSITDNGILFFVHVPRFLAHTNPLFKILSENSDKNMKITIASLSYNHDFKLKCDELGVNFINLNHNCENNNPISLSAYLRLNEISKNYKHFIWQCLPVNLSFFSQLNSNISWWSLKFHPNIPNLKSYIGTFTDKDPIVKINDNNWNNYFSGFSLKNINLHQAHWNIRKKYFGSFCREELIDKREFWEIISKILKDNDNIIYCYTGRKSIHEKWTKRLSIDEKKIKHLGWLSDPEKFISQMAFLIEGRELGHGMLAYEAMLAKVPIIGIDCKDFYGAFKNRLIFDNKINLKKTLLPNLEIELLIQVKKLLNDQEYNNKIGTELRTLIINSQTSDNFDKFFKILEKSS